MLVVVGPPSFDLLLGILPRQEPVFVQTLGAEPTIERFNQGIVCRLSRATEVQLHAISIRPLIQRFRGELGTVVDADRFGKSR